MLPQGPFSESGRVREGTINPTALFTADDPTCDRCDQPFLAGEEVRAVDFAVDVTFVEHASHPVCQALVNAQAYCAVHELQPDASTEECAGYEVAWAGSRNGTTH